MIPLAYVPLLLGTMLGTVSGTVSEHPSTVEPSADMVASSTSYICQRCVSSRPNIFWSQVTSPVQNTTINWESSISSSTPEPTTHVLSVGLPFTTTTDATTDTTSTIINTEPITPSYPLNTSHGSIFEVDPLEIEIPIIDIANNTNNTVHAKNHSNLSVEDYHFMSFEEWKKNKIDASEHEANASNGHTHVKPNGSFALDTPSSALSSSLNTSISDNEPYELALRGNITEQAASKDGDEQGKVYKDKFNYASVDCAATVVKTNSLASGASSILVENKDSYLLNQCSSPNKFVIIELCQDILVESVAMGNFEFFSSTFKGIRISVSDRFPATQWTTLGEFEAENVRDIQNFKIQNPRIWARYLKLEILSHYGNEFYCPISLVRVHGKTMIEEFKEESKESSEDTVAEEVASNLILDLESGLENESFNECRVVMPHLGLNEFLKDINSTSAEYCDANYASEQTSQVIEPITTQESIYKNIIKRLSLLESNASLSLLYIEEQSKLLSSAFTNLERRQSNNFEILIDSFNTTIVNQLLNFKKSYINLHNDYARLFKIQESLQQSLLSESKKKIAVLGSDITFQKRLSLFNCVIIVCLLVYVIITRDTYIHDLVETKSKHRRKQKYYYPTGLVSKNYKRAQRYKRG